MYPPYIINSSFTVRITDWSCKCKHSEKQWHKLQICRDNKGNDCRVQTDAEEGREIC